MSYYISYTKYKRLQQQQEQQQEHTITEPHFIFHYEKPFFQLAQRQRTPWSNKTKAGNGKNKEEKSGKEERSKTKKNLYIYIDAKQCTKNKTQKAAQRRPPCIPLIHSTPFKSWARPLPTFGVHCVIVLAWSSLGLGLGTTLRRTTYPHNPCKRPKATRQQRRRQRKRQS